MKLHADRIGDLVPESLGALGTADNLGAFNGACRTLVRDGLSEADAIALVWNDGGWLFGIGLAHAYVTGHDDGRGMAEESLSAGVPPREVLDSPESYDSILVSAIGPEAACLLFAQDPAESSQGWSTAMQRLLTVYDRAAREGAERYVAEYEASRS